MSWNLKATRVWLLLSVAIVSGVTVAAAEIIQAHAVSRDSGVFLYIGNAILRGQLPYVDAWDHKPPGIYYINAAILWALPNSVPSVHAAQGLYLASSAVVFFALARRLELSTIPAAVGTVLYSTWVSDPILSEGGNLTESYLPLPLLAAFYLLTIPRANMRSPGNYAILFSSGALLGAAVLIRPTAVLYLGVASGYWVGVLFVRERAIRSGLPGAAALIVGTLCPVSLTTMYFALEGGLGAFFQQVVLFNILYVGANDPSLWFRDLVSSGWKAFSAITLMWALGLSGLVIIVTSLKARLSSRMSLLLLWFAADLFSFLLGGRFWLHYYLLLIPSVSLLATYALSQIHAQSFGLRRSPVTQTLGITIVLLAVIPMTMRWAQALDSLGDIPEPRYDQELLATIDELTKKDEYIYIWGAEAGLYYLADRQSSSRYIYNYPLIGRFGGNDRPELVNEAYIETLFRDLEQRPPKVVLLQPGHRDLSNAPYFEKFLNQSYGFVGEVQHWPIYVRK